MRYIYVSVFLVFLLACTQMPQDQEFISVEELQSLETVSQKLVKQYQPTRDEYPLGTVQVREWTIDDKTGQITEKRTVKRFQVTDLMKNLCPLPDDFWSYKYVMTTGRITQQELAKLDECYFTQPEWYGNDFVDIALKKYTNPDLEHWTPEGYGNFPVETILYSKAGQIHNIYTFFGTSWIVEQYQGIGLDIIYPTAVRDQTGKFHELDKSSERYITASVNPRNVLLAPAYVMFEAVSDGNNGIDSCADMENPCWRRKINLTVTVADDTPPGVYGIGFDVVPVDGFYRAQWSEKYKEKFSGGSMLLKPTQEMFKLTVIVE